MNLITLKLIKFQQTLISKPLKTPNRIHIKKVPLFNKQTTFVTENIISIENGFSTQFAYTNTLSHILL